MQDITLLLYGLLFLKTKINNTNLNIGYIDGADHSYTGKEEILAEEILKFVRSV